MRKRFFKKLSLGMALALVLGTTAHAGVAQAAAATWNLKKNSATVYLNEDNVKGTPDNYDFNFKNKPDNWKKDYSFNWYSENEEVATVAKGGVVTGVSVGEATIVCEIVNKKTFEVETVKAKVTVKANAAAVEISNAAKYDAEKDVVVKTGEVIDLNRTMYDENGNKTTKRGKFVTDYTRWYVLDENGQAVDKEVATVNQKNGQFVINKAGIYALVCETYQSAKNPQAIVNDFVMVVVEDAKPEIDAVQTTVRKFELELANPIDKAILDNGKVEEAYMDKIDVVLDVDGLEGNDRIVLPIKNIDAIKEFTDENGMVSKVTVEMWDRFEDGKLYTIGLKKEKSATDFEENKDITKVVYEATDDFVASVGKPAKIDVSIVNPLRSLKDKVDNVVYVTDKLEYQDFKLKFFDANKIDVTEVYFDADKEVLLTDGDLVGEIVAANEDDLYWVDADFNALEIKAFEGGEGKKYQLVMTYYEYTDKGEIQELARSAKDFTVQAEPKANPLTVDSIVINKWGSAPAYRESWESRSTAPKIAANDTDLYVAASIIDDWGRKYSNVTGELRFYSSNPQVAEVDLYDGKFTPYEVGSVRVNVYVADEVTGDETFAGSVTVKILTERKAEKVVINTNVSKPNQELESHVLANKQLVDVEVNGSVLHCADNDDATTPLDNETISYYVKVIDNHGEEMTNLQYSDFAIDTTSAKYFTMDEKVSHTRKDNVNWGYLVTVSNFDYDVVEAITTPANYKRASVTLNGTIGLEANEKAGQKLSVTVRKPVDEDIHGYKMYTVSEHGKSVAYTGMRSSAYDANVKVYGVCENGVRVWEYTDESLNTNKVYYTATDIKSFVNRLNAKEEPKVKWTDDEKDIKATVTTGTALVYTITKSGKTVVANGAGVAKTATGSAAADYSINSSVITSIAGGETMNALADHVITFNKLHAVDFTTGDKYITYTNATGEYVLTLYKVNATTNDKGETTYSYAKATTTTLKVDPDKSDIKVVPRAIATDVNNFSLNFGNKLVWTDNEDVREVITECFDIQIADGNINGYFWDMNIEDIVKEDGTVDRGFDMLFNVRVNSDTMYVKAIKVLVPLGNNQYSVLEAQVGWTITFNK